MSVVEMRMLGWKSEVTRLNRIQNDYVRRSIDVVSIAVKMRENRLRLFEYVMM
jgi:hypothetical protein